MEEPSLHARTSQAMTQWLGEVPVIDERELAELLADFTRAMVTATRPRDTLDMLLARMAEVLSVASVGVVLADASGAGPFSELDRQACPARPLRTAGSTPVSTYALRHGDTSIGALELYGDSSRQRGLDASDLHESDRHAAQLLADVVAAFVINARTRADLQRTCDRNRHDATHDELTGLPNRVLLQERLAQSAARARKSRTATAVMFADIDGFKWVNDAYGHFVGDDVLVAVADRLALAGRAGDMLARVSGDEFIVVCEGIGGLAAARSLAARFSNTLREPFVIDGIEIAITMSVGVAFAGPGQPITLALVDRADTAMYRAKRAGGDGHRIAVAPPVARSDRNSMEMDLRSALAAGTLDLAYQPIVRADDDRIVGVEALLRWTHPERGSIAAIDAIRIAEETELIEAIGRWTLERGCSDHADWKQANPDQPLYLAINLSASHVASAEFVESVVDALLRTAMQPADLVLEITENVVLEDTEIVLRNIAELRALGIRFALDDFGTGYSSMSYLARLPIEVLKIDRSFITEITTGQMAGRAVIEAIANLGHSLGLAVIAEGVETEHQRAVVAALGCEYIQGYLCGRPVAAAAIASTLSKSSGVGRR